MSRWANEQNFEQLNAFCSVLASKHLCSLCAARAREQPKCAHFSLLMLASRHGLLNFICSRSRAKTVAHLCTRAIFAQFVLASMLCSDALIISDDLVNGKPIQCFSMNYDIQIIVKCFKSKIFNRNSLLTKLLKSRALQQNLALNWKSSSNYFKTYRYI